jgi:hypothetical protein
MRNYVPKSRQAAECGVAFLGEMSRPSAALAYIRGRHLTGAQRKRWVSLLLAAIENPIGSDAAMPAWGWGEVKGPYIA